MAATYAGTSVILQGGKIEYVGPGGRANWDPA